ncbi:GNAT family N-acetyltransferase [Streptomyces albus]|nr:MULTISPECIES: GNAT family N-acetyltransferase [Streptomyces]
METAARDANSGSPTDGWADDVDATVAAVTTALRAVVDEDWSVPAHGLEWSCRETAVHLADDFVGYATQLTGRAAEGYAPFEIVAVPGTDPRGLARIVHATGGLLSAAVRTTPPQVRGWHPYGAAGPDGFAAMGIVEALVHTHDITAAFPGTPWKPPARLCERVLDRLFPHVPRPEGADPWQRLLYATGRPADGSEPPLTAWRWYAAPLRTERLLLCELSPPLAADLSEGGSGGFSWAGNGPEEGTRTAAGMVASAAEEGSHRPGWGTYVIVRAEDGRAVGGIGFHAPPDAHGMVETGYDVVTAARGQGCATEALTALAGWALADPSVRLVRARAAHTNAASHAVLTKAGFRAAGCDEETVLYEKPGG